jgi:hypothetical protein
MYQISIITEQNYNALQLTTRTQRRFISELQKTGTSSRIILVVVRTQVNLLKKA